MSERNEPTSSPHGPTGARRRRGGLRLAVALACGVAGIGGTGAFALAAAGGWTHGPRLERMQGMVLHALDAVGATTAQEAKIHDIVAATVTGLQQDGGDREAMRKQMLDLLRAPTIDRVAVEKLRVEQVAAFDTKSKIVANALLDASDQLSPAQRSQLADKAETMMQRHSGMGPDGSWGRHRDGGMDRHGPDGGPDGGPDKG